jgi:hypothetical protein
MAKPKTEWRYLVYLNHVKSLRPGDKDEIKSPSGMHPQDWFRWDYARNLMVYQGRGLTLSEYTDLLNDPARQDRLVQTGCGVPAKTPRWFISVLPIEAEIDVLAEKTLDRKQLKATPELSA